MRLLQHIVKIIKHLFVYLVSGWVHPKSQVKQVPRTTMFGLDNFFNADTSTDQRAPICFSDTLYMV